MGYSPWGHKELDTTERLSTHTHSIFLSQKAFFFPVFFFFFPFQGIMRGKKQEIRKDIEVIQ